ncbi:MAG: hypothetical protein KY452_07490 [Actinobacteria bacterium]|nr:hypothetical protein [Actinomycetota bacterium]
MRQVEATTTPHVRRARTAAAPAHAALGNPWLISLVPGFAMRPTAMHTKGTCRPPEAPT